MEKKKDILLDKVNQELLNRRGFQGELAEIERTIHSIAFDYYRIPGKKDNPDLKHNLRLIETEPLIFTYCTAENKSNIATTLNPTPIKMNGYIGEFSNKKGKIDDKTYRILKEIEKYLRYKGINDVYCIVVLPYNKTHLEEKKKYIKKQFRSITGVTLKENYMIRNSKHFEKIPELQEHYNKLVDRLNHLELNDIMNTNERYWKATRISDVKSILPEMVDYREDHPDLTPNKIFMHFVDKGAVNNTTTIIEFLNKWIKVWNKLHSKDSINDPSKNTDKKTPERKSTLRNSKTATALFNKLTIDNIKEFCDSIPGEILQQKPGR